MLPEKEIFEKIGKPLKIFLHSKFKNQKMASRNLKISPAFLSLVIRGKRLAPPSLQNKLKLLGFDSTVFDYYFLQPETVDKVEYTFEEFTYTVRHLKQIINNKDLIIEQMEHTIKNLRINWEHEKILHREQKKFLERKIEKLTKGSVS